MSSIYCFLGLPWWRKPSTLPSKTASAKFPALPLVTCPKYCSFIQATFPINPFPDQSLLILIYWFVFFPRNSEHLSPAPHLKGLDSIFSILHTIRVESRHFRQLSHFWLPQLLLTLSWTGIGPATPWRFSASRLSAKPVLYWQTFYNPNSRRSWRKPFQ